MALIHMKVAGVVLDPTSGMPIIILKDDEGRITLPIWVGIFEAAAIAMQLAGIAPKRPQTHDLLRSVVEEMGGELMRVVIDDFKEHTFYAKIFISCEGREIVIDSRPSDAIALALRAHAPIFVEEELIEGARKAERPVGRDPEDLKKLLESLKEEDFGKYKM